MIIWYNWTPPNNEFALKILFFHPIPYMIHMPFELLCWMWIYQAYFFLNKYIIYIQELLNLISDIVSKQYNTIIMEEQDINTFDDLTIEKERKIDTLETIKLENESEEFRSVFSFG